MISTRFLASMLAVIAPLILIPSNASAHDGRRFDVVIVDGKIYAQGYNSAATDDGAGHVRAYQNAIHVHWENIGGSIVADLPGFDVTFGDSYTTPTGDVHQYGYDNGADALRNHDLILTLTGAGRWTTPGMGDIVLDSLDSGESITANLTSGSGSLVSTADLGTSPQVVGNIVPGWATTAGSLDLDLDYTLNIDPSSPSIYYLQWQLSSGNSAIEASDGIYTIFAPPGAHHPALRTESLLGVTASIPEPSGVLITGIVSGIVVIRRRRK